MPAGVVALAPLILLAHACVGPGSRSHPDQRPPDVVTSEAPSIQGVVTRKASDRILIEEEPLDSSVSAWFEGPVLQSYPVQATASAVRIESEEGASNLVEIDGIIRYHELEGGFYAIQSSDGETYNPTNLPEEYRQDGLPVRAKIRIRNDLLGIHQAGPLVEIVEIRKR